MAKLRLFINTEYNQIIQSYPFIVNENFKKEIKAVNSIFTESKNYFIEERFK